MSQDDRGLAVGFSRFEVVLCLWKQRRLVFAQKQAFTSDTRATHNPPKKGGLPYGRYALAMLHPRQPHDSDLKRRRLDVKRDEPRDKRWR